MKHGGKKFNVQQRDVFIVGRPLKESEKSSKQVLYHEGKDPGKDLVDHEIEMLKGRKGREFIPVGVGKACITIEPGYDRPGEIYVNVQLETKPGNPDGCQTLQNKFLLENTSCLKALLEEISAHGVAWDVGFAGTACPKAEVPLDIETAAAVLDQLEANVQTEERVVHRNENTNEVRG